MGVITHSALPSVPNMRETSFIVEYDLVTSNNVMLYDIHRLEPAEPSSEPPDTYHRLDRVLVAPQQRI